MINYFIVKSIITTYNKMYTLSNVSNHHQQILSSSYYYIVYTPKFICHICKFLFS